MLMKSTRCQCPAFVALVLASSLSGPASAQVSYSLQHSIPAPPTFSVSGSFGSSVAFHSYRLDINTVAGAIAVFYDSNPTPLISGATFRVTTALL